METDYLCREVKAALQPGDLVVFENVGAYTNVLKPPFIRLQPPIFTIENGRSQMAQRAETAEDVMRSFIYN